MADLCASSCAQFNKQKVIFQFFDHILKGIRHKQAQTGFLFLLVAVLAVRHELLGLSRFSGEN